MSDNFYSAKFLLKFYNNHCEEFSGIFAETLWQSHNTLNYESFFLVMNFTRRLPRKHTGFFLIQLNTRKRMFTLKGVLADNYILCKGTKN